MNPILVVIGLAASLATFALIVAGAYLGGGSAAVQSNAGRLRIVAVALIGVGLIGPVVVSSGGAVATVVALAIANIVAIVLLVRQSNTDGSGIIESLRRGLGLTSFRVIAIAWICLLIVGLALLIAIKAS